MHLIFIFLRMLYPFSIAIPGFTPHPAQGDLLHVNQVNPENTHQNININTLLCLHVTTLQISATPSANLCALWRACQLVRQGGNWQTIWFILINWILSINMTPGGWGGRWDHKAHCNAVAASYRVFFFNWCPPKKPKCQPVSKFWHLELFW